MEFVDDVSSNSVKFPNVQRVLNAEGFREEFENRPYVPVSCFNQPPWFRYESCTIGIINRELTLSSVQQR